MFLIKKYLNGYTLVELLISMSITLIVISSAVVFFSVNSKFGTQHLQENFLRAQLHLLATTIGDEIGRAGFCYNCTSGNPYILKDDANKASSLLLEDSATKAKGDCIRFAYNHNKRENPMSIHKDDAKGYRLGKDPSKRPVIEIYENRNGLTNWNCTNSGSGSTGYWQDLTYHPLVIDNFTLERQAFSVIGTTHVLQTLNVHISASLESDPTIRDSITLKINLQNVDT